MKTETVQIQKTIYRSEKFPEIKGEDWTDGVTIEFLDDNPVVYDIVTKIRSKAFGRNSSTYIGWAQKNNSVDAILSRVGTFARELKKTGIWGWRANFALEHYRDKHFRGGFFQQWDAAFPRNGLTLDYTPETLNQALETFRCWCGDLHQTTRITINKRDVWTA